MGFRFLIVCGGTGGHLAPGIAVAEELLGRGHRCSLVISRKEVDSRLVRKYGHLDFVRLPGAAFGKSPREAGRFFSGLAGGLAAGRRILRRERPDVVLAFGGFLSLGIVLFAAWNRLPIALHEANRRPGRAVRMLGRFADRVYLPPGVRLSSVPEGAVRCYGYPVRREFRRMSRRAAREKLGLNPEGFLLAVFGGSQGATALNEWVDRHCREILSRGIDVFCVRGLGKGAEGVLEEKDGRGNVRRCHTVGFCDSMHWVLSAADLAVSRAGAGSIAELVHCALPSVLVPYPFASDGHQTENARYLEAQGGCVVVEQDYLDTLLGEVSALAANPGHLARMRENLGLAADAERKEDLASDLEKLAAGFRARRPARTAEA